MNFISRVIRMFRADIHGVLDRFEDKELLLKQSLREMEQELSAEEAGLGMLASSLDRTREEYQKMDDQCRKLEEDVDSALMKDREDLALLLLRKLKEKSKYRDDLGRQVETLEGDYNLIRGRFEERRLQYQNLKTRATQFFRTAQAGKPAPVIRLEDDHDPLSDRMDAELELELMQRKEALQKG